MNELFITPFVNTIFAKHITDASLIMMGDLVDFLDKKNHQDKERFAIDFGSVNICCALFFVAYTHKYSSKYGFTDDSRYRYNDIKKKYIENVVNVLFTIQHEDDKFYRAEDCENVIKALSNILPKKEKLWSNKLDDNSAFFNSGLLEIYNNVGSISKDYFLFSGINTKLRKHWDENFMEGL